MRNTVSIKKNPAIMLEGSLREFLNPKYVFFPIEEGDKLRVKDNMYVYKNDILMLTADNIGVHSSVSGKVLGVKEMLYHSGKKSSLVIENDFKENTKMRRSARKYIDSYTKQSFLDILEDTGLFQNGGYSYQKFENCQNLLINTVDCEPYFGNRYFYTIENIDSILETVDLIGELFGIEKREIAIKNVESAIVSGFMDMLGTYPNISIRLLEDDYQNGLDEYLKKNSNPGTLVLGVEEIVDIYNTLKKEMPITEKIITITGEAISPMSAVRVKKGTLLAEIFINNFDFTAKSVDVYLNGMMRGEIVDTLKYVVDDDLEGILVMEKGNISESECINCGLCHKNCPMNLNPKYVRDHNGKVKSEYTEECLQCGLCNYVCPVHRELRKYMRGGTS